MAYNLDASGWFVGAIEQPNSFRLIRLLGIGGESQVWLSQASEESQDADSANRYAIKIFHEGIDPTNDFDWLNRFNEIKMISNPVMAKIYEVFIGPEPHSYQISNVKSTQQRYLIMEYADGPTLGDWIIDHPKAPFHERIEILRTLAYGIDDLHRGLSALGSIVHGDIKPWNVRITNSGDVRLVDFGRTNRYPSSLSAVAISVPYAAPELYTGGSATISSDRYAFSATAFNVLTGQQVPADMTIRARMLHDSITSQRQGLVDSVLQGLAVAPDTRPSCLEICGTGTHSSRLSVISACHIAPPPPNSFAEPPTGAAPLR